MHILQVVNSLDPVDGGPPTAVLRLSAALACEGATVTLYSIERPGREAEIASTLQGIPGIERVRRCSDVCDNTVDRLLGRPARAFLQRAGADFDLIQVHGLWSPPLRAILKVAVRRSFRYVITPHGMLARWALAQKPRRKKLALLLSWRRLIARSLFVQALTRAEAEDYRQLGIDAPVEIIPNGFFPEEMGNLPAPGAFHAAHPELGGQRFILSLARLHYVKRADLLVRAFAKVAKVIPDLRLVLAGPDCGTKSLVETGARLLGLQQRVHLPGPLYGPQKYAAMADALCFCQTSVYETFSMSILEAMACGLPPVITKGCNFDEVGASGAGMVTDGGEDALADALVKMCTDAEARARAAEKARALVLAKYTWPIVARQMLASSERRLGATPVAVPGTDHRDLRR
jgi:glycosyltransferase involved in cell wall biosynthesis